MFWVMMQKHAIFSNVKLMINYDCFVSDNIMVYSVLINGYC